MNPKIAVSAARMRLKDPIKEGENGKKRRLRVG